MGAVRARAYLFFFILNKEFKVVRQFRDLLDELNMIARVYGRVRELFAKLNNSGDRKKKKKKKKRPKKREDEMAVINL